MKTISLLLGAAVTLLCSSCQQPAPTYNTYKTYRSYHNHSSSPGLHLGPAPGGQGIDAVGQPDSFSG